MKYEFHPEALEEYREAAYTIESDFVLIVAVAHCAREPGHWKGRLARK